MSAACELRPAVAADARAIAELVEIASDGVALVDWTAQAAAEPGLAPLDIGARTYAREHGDYSFRNAVLASVDGATAGLLLSFPMPPREPGAAAPPPPYDGRDVFAPYRYLEAPDTWYVCGVACYPAYRGSGIGTRLMAVAAAQAVERGYARLSLVAFAANRGAVRLYERLGYRTVARAPIVPHPLIRHTGEALLMTAPAAA